MTALKDPLVIILQHEHSFSLLISLYQIFQASSDKKTGLMRRGHCIKTLALAQPVAGLCDLGLKGITEGGDGPLTPPHPDLFWHIELCSEHLI